MFYLTRCQLIEMLFFCARRLINQWTIIFRFRLVQDRRIIIYSRLDFESQEKTKKKLDIDDFVFRIYELIRLVSVFPKVVRLTMVNRQRRHRIVLIQHVRTRV